MGAMRELVRGTLSGYASVAWVVFEAGVASKGCHTRPVNTASQDLPHHLEVLGQKLQHPTDYELALNYFLEEFAGDTGFMGQSEPEGGFHLEAVLSRAAAQALGKPQASLEQFRAFRLPKHGFNHGNAAAEGHVLLFFYFEKLDTGLMALFPGVRGAAEVARFRVPGGLKNPKNN
jgi:hypothetical protein